MLYANNKDADQPAHQRSLISVFIVRWLDNTWIIPTFAKYEKKKKKKKEKKQDSS